MKDEMIVRYRFWHFTWSDEREQDWLRAMAREGLHLVRANSGIGRYVFQRGAPQDMVYSVEFRGGCTARAGGTERGWEPVAGACGWAYWRKPALALAAGESHVDARTRAAMLQRLLGVMVVCGMPMFTNAVLFQRTLFDVHHYSSPISYVSVVGIYGAMALAYVVAFARLASRIHHYKRSAA